MPAARQLKQRDVSARSEPQEEVRFPTVASPTAETYCEAVVTPAQKDGDMANWDGTGKQVGARVGGSESGGEASTSEKARMHAAEAVADGRRKRPVARRRAAMPIPSTERSVVQQVVTLATGGAHGARSHGNVRT
jgi:hypothetical protein